MSIDGPASAVTLRAFGGASGIPDAEWLAANADIYIDANTVTTGPDNAITGLTADGLLAAAFTMIGAGVVQKTSTGFVFNDGQYLRFSPVSTAYTKALSVIKFRRIADPNGVGELLNLDASPAAERHMLRYTAAQNLALTGSGSTAFSNAQVANGDTVTLAMWIDFPNQIYEVMDFDGFSNGLIPNTGGALELNLGRTQIGRRCNAEIERIAVFLATGSNPLAADLTTAWERVSGISTLKITSNIARLMAGAGQSLDVGATSTLAERDEIEAIARGNVTMHTGLVRTDAAQLHIHGPGNLGIDQTVSATGLTQAVPASNIPPRYMSAIVLNAHRADVGLPALNIMFQGVSISGVSIDEIDNDDPVITGALGTTVIDNFAYTAAQLKAQAVARAWAFEIEDMVILQGTADRAEAQGVWLAAAQEVFDDWKARAATDPNILAPFTGLSVWQTGGDENTVGEAYWVKQDQIQLVVNNGGTLIGPIHPIPLVDGPHPGLPGYKIMAETQAWAQAEVEAGNPWNIIPSATRSGNTITVDFTLRPGETLVSEDRNYGGLGYINHGLQVTGAVITSVIIGSTSVTINCDGPASEVIYAMQEQDVSVLSPGFSAHRGLLRGSETKAAKLLFDGTLYRDITGFRLAV